MPEGRHVLLAACRSSETAKEVNENGKSHGAFSAALLAALRQTGGVITYHDLVKRAESQVRRRVAQQVPQIEASNADDLLLPFLGGAAQRGRLTPTLSFDKSIGWIVDCGAIHGIAEPHGTETTSFAVFDLDAALEERRSLETALAVIELTEVRPQLSCVAIKSSNTPLNPALTYQAICIATPLPKKRVFLTGEGPALTLARQALGNIGLGKPSLLVEETAVEREADFRVKASGTGFIICRASADRPLVAEIARTDNVGASLLVTRLEHIARWQAIAELRNDTSSLGSSIQVTVRLQISDGRGKRWTEADPRGRPLYYARDASGIWQPPRLRITLTNASNAGLHCALLWLGEDYSVSSSLFPAGAQFIPARASMDVYGGKTLAATIPDEKWKTGRTELTDHLKLIVSREQFDPALFQQGALDTYVSVRAARELVPPPSALNRLAARVHARDIEPEPNETDDWATSDIMLTVVRPLDDASVPMTNSKVALGAGVTLLGHAKFRAQVHLASITEGGRALGTRAVPALFRDDPALSQPFLFESPRGTDPGLGALELTKIQNADTVTTENPLRLHVGLGLSPGEHVIPFAWDGEFYLPLGVGRSTDSGTEIELRQIPVFSTPEDIERGITSSIRIMFQKIASPYLPICFDYPHLAAVTIDEHGQPAYEKTFTAVRDKVASANRILLYVHGILGDTVGMTAASAVNMASSGATAAALADCYDLILAFDYENINTSIKESARALKQRLAAVGLGENHGKLLHIAAHSMGGLVSRWFIEQEGGKAVVQHLVSLGTPHAGSPWPTLENWATAALAIGLNGLTQVAWPLKLVGDLASAIEILDVALDEMAPNSTLLKILESSPDPGVPYTLLVGNTAIIPPAVTNGTLGRLLSKLAPQRVLHDVTSLAFFNSPNDIAVAVTSAQGVPTSRVPAPMISQVACDHITFFATEAGRRALWEALHSP